MVTISTTAMNVSFRARTTTAVTRSVQGTAMPIVRHNGLVDGIGDVPAGIGVCYDATGFEAKGLGFAGVTPLGHRAWSPPS